MVDLGNFAGAAAFFTKAAISAHHHEHQALERSAKLLEIESKRVLGTYDYGWPSLKPATVARKARGDTPLLEKGDMRASIEHTVGAGEAEVGSNSDIAVYQELGTSRIPPRSFLGGAARRKESEIIHILSGAVKLSLP